MSKLKFIVNVISLRMINKFDNNRQMDNKNSQFISSRMDDDNKINLPSFRTNNKRDNENNYFSIPYKSGNGTRDVEVENYMKSGSCGGQSKRSNGYPSVFEHNFQYISNDTINNNVMDRAAPSRNNNKSEVGFSKQRQVM